MTFKHLIPCAALVAAFFWTPDALAQATFCGSKEEVERVLASHAETPRWRGLSQRGHVTVIYENSKKKTWTAVVYLQDGRVCLADVGTFGELIVGGYNERS